MSNKNPNLIIMMWVCFIVANIQMLFLVPEENTLLNYFGFIPLVVCWILLIIEIRKKRKELEAGIKNGA